MGGISPVDKLRLGEIFQIPEFTVSLAEAKFPHNMAGDVVLYSHD